MQRGQLGDVSRGVKDTAKRSEIGVTAVWPRWCDRAAGKVSEAQELGADDDGPVDGRAPFLKGAALWTIVYPSAACRWFTAVRSILKVPILAQRLIGRCCEPSVRR
jgi:hypothetical protein